MRCLIAAGKHVTLLEAVARERPLEIQQAGKIVCAIGICKGWRVAVALELLVVPIRKKRRHTE
jgi:hypothetical protein